MLKLTDLNIVGAGEHRSGWPYCIEALTPLLHDDAPVLLDDFVERTFLYDKKWHHELVYERPWIGVLHHPPDMPNWYFDKLHLQNLIHNPRWVASLPYCRMFISMGTNLTKWLRQTFPNVPVTTLRHPTGRPMVYWSPERFEANTKKRLVQVGWFLRNTHAIYQADAPAWMKKTHLCQKLNWIEYAHWLCKKSYAQLHPERTEINETETMAQVDDTRYDLLLAENVAFVEVISAVANNTVVECMARNTPICINRHPGPEYYLGRDYPLFYDHFSEIPEVLTIPKILAAHAYLAKMDKWWIRGGMFREHVRAACLEHIPECRAFTTRKVAEHQAYSI